LVNMIPRADSDETRQDSQTMLAVHQDRQLIVGAAYYTVSMHSNVEMLPLYLSTDGGWSWQLKPLLPVGSLAFQSYSFSGSGKKLYGAILINKNLRGFNLGASVLETDDPTSDTPMRDISNLKSEASGEGDNPFIQARTFNEERVYVGQNYFGSEL